MCLRKVSCNNSLENVCTDLFRKYVKRHQRNFQMKQLISAFTVNKNNLTIQNRAARRRNPEFYIQSVTILAVVN